MCCHPYLKCPTQVMVEVCSCSEIKFSHRIGPHCHCHPHLTRPQAMSVAASPCSAVVSSAAEPRDDEPAERRDAQSAQKNGWMSLPPQTQPLSSAAQSSPAILLVVRQEKVTVHLSFKLADFFFHPSFALSLFPPGHQRCGRGVISGLRSPLLSLL